MKYQSKMGSSPRPISTRLLNDSRHLHIVPVNLVVFKGFYDTNQIIAYAADAGMNIVIPAERNRKQQREYDRYLYRLRHLVENAFLHLKRWRGIATRYAKTTTSFLAAVQIRCIAIWCTVLT